MSFEETCIGATCDFLVNRTASTYMHFHATAHNIRERTRYTPKYVTCMTKILCAAIVQVSPTYLSRHGARCITEPLEGHDLYTNLRSAVKIIFERLVEDLYAQTAHWQRRMDFYRFKLTLGNFQRACAIAHYNFHEEALRCLHRAETHELEKQKAVMEECKRCHRKMVAAYCSGMQFRQRLHHDAAASIVQKLAILEWTSEKHSDRSDQG